MDSRSRCYTPILVKRRAGCSRFGFFYALLGDILAAEFRVRGAHICGLKLRMGIMYKRRYEEEKAGRTPYRSRG